MQTINWNQKQDAAKKMTTNQLVWAISDCVATAEAMGSAPMMGKDAGYYMDEASVYRTELAKR